MALNLTWSKTNACHDFVNSINNGEDSFKKGSSNSILTKKRRKNGKRNVSSSKVKRRYF